MTTTGDFVLTDDGWLKIIDPDTLEQKRLLPDFAENVELAGDRRHVLTEQGIVDLESGISTQLSDVTGAEAVLALSQTGRWVAVSNQELRIVDSEAGLSRAFDTGGRLAVAGAFSSDERRLAVALLTGTAGAQALELVAYSVATGEQDAVLALGAAGDAATSAGSALRLAFVDQEQILAISSFGAQVWNLSTGELLWSNPDARQAGLVGVAQQIWYAPGEAAPGTAEVLDLGTAQVIRTIANVATPDALSSDLVRPRGPRPVLAWDAAGEVGLFANAQGMLVSSRDGEAERPIAAALGGWGGRSTFIASDVIARFSSVGSQPVLRTHRVPAGTLLNEYAPAETQSEWPGALALSPDGTLLAAAFPEGVHILAVSDLTSIAYIPRSANALAWSGDGRRLAITPDLHYRDEGRPPRSEPLELLEEWETDPPRLAQRYDVPGVPIFVAYSLDGESLVAGTVERESDSAATDMARVPLDMAASRGLVIHRDRGTIADYPLSPIAAAHGFATDGASLSGPALDSPVVPLASSLLWSPWSGGVIPAFSGDGALLAGFLDPEPNAAAAADIGRLVVFNGHTGARLSDVASPVGPAFNLAMSSDGSFVASSLGGSEETRYYCLHER